jgi:site-specific DNA-methyltransferase (adenine-specific)
MDPYYSDGIVTLFLGDCREATSWLDADFLCCDPPYGRKWRQGNLKTGREKNDARAGIKGDESTEIRDWILEQWGTEKRAAIFGDLMLAPPANVKQVLVYEKPFDSGRRGSTGGFRRDAEAIYLMGKWASGIADGSSRSSVLRTATLMLSGAAGLGAAQGHPLAKPVDVLARLIPKDCTLVADPCAGSGSTLMAARQLGIPSIGVEVDEVFAERAANNLSQQTMF